MNSLSHKHTHSKRCKCNAKKVIQFRTNNILRADPTRTLLLRKAFVAQMNIRFRKLKGEINKAIITNDVFGLIPKPKLAVFKAPGPRAFAFGTSADKVNGFMNWLQEEIDKGILQVSTKQGRQIAGSSSWMNVYIDSAYKKGMQRADSELKKAGITPSSITPDQSKAFVIDSAFNTPIHADAVGLAYTRTFNELKGVTDAMGQQISRELALGLAEGRGPRSIARAINNRVDKIGITRARTIARTETIRAHHSAMMNMYREAKVEGVKILAEWSTAGFNVCPDCSDLEGRIFTINEIDGLIPLHPNCRCIAIPAGVGEDKSKTNKEQRDATIGEQFKRKDGSAPKRGLFEKQSGKSKLPPRSVSKARKRR